MRFGRIHLAFELLLLTFAVLFTGRSQSGSAQTTLPAVIAQNTTLDKANSPYMANQDVRVLSGAKLRVEEGVLIYFNSNAGLYVEGNIEISGSQSDPIVMKAAPGHSKWEVLSIISATETTLIKWLEIHDCTVGDNSDRDRAAISVKKTKVLIDHCTISNVDRPIFLEGCRDVVISNSILSARTSCDYVNFLETTGIIENNEFIGDNSTNTDAIDFDGSQGTIRGNYIHGFTGYNTDAIDIGGEASTAIIENNIIQDIFDKGVSIGEKATATVRFNLISNTAAGIASKDLSVVHATNNTLYRNDTAYQAFSRDGVNWGGGFLYIENGIILEAGVPVSARDNSTLTVNYTLCSSSQLPGTGNLFGDPQLVNPSLKNFNLKPTSICIDAGNPSSPPDPDGTRADMGAYPYSQKPLNNLIISEIHYRPVPVEGQSVDYEFIELYNRGSSSIALGGFQISKGVVYTFTNGTQISPGEFILLVKDITKYAELNCQKFQWWDDELSDTGEEIEIRDDNNNLFIQFSYSFASPWPELSSENRSIELEDLTKEFQNPENWRLSKRYGGSPGSENTAGLIADLLINEVLSKSTALFPDDHGDPSDWIELTNKGAVPIDIGGLFVSNQEGNPSLYQIPASSSGATTIVPGQYLLMYASGETDKGVLHLPFSLASGGGDFGIYQYFEGSYRSLSFVQIPALTEGQSYARISLDQSDFEITDSPTPGAPNEFLDPQLYFKLKINEFVAKYDNNYPDEFGFYSDWIEIYNSGKDPIRMDGIYFSDRKSEPTRFRLPFVNNSTSLVEPGGFIVFRADAKPELGFNHLDFELSSGGEDIVLAAEINGSVEILDQLSYGPQREGVSYGRTTDGGNIWDFMNPPTPGYSNSSSSVYATELGTFTLQIYPNPANNFVIIETNQDLALNYEALFDLYGREYQIDSKQLSPGRIQLNLKGSSGSLKPGLYLVKLRFDGASVLERFLVR